MSPCRWRMSVWRPVRAAPPTGAFCAMPRPLGVDRSTRSPSVTRIRRSSMTEFRTLRAGVFLPPFHPNDEDPLLCIERDFELMQWLDRLGYAEAWIGEHHSGGYELYGQPELFIATAAERTQHIRLGTGVISLPYHHPLMVADRIVQLDYQTRGRA